MDPILRPIGVEKGMDPERESPFGEQFPGSEVQPEIAVDRDKGGCQEGQEEDATRQQKIEPMR